ncbi:MAG: D-isomer specific 2-hydroxyacid dehydrogenase NAD-binding [Xanthobacteraceae bacterium]|nr:D-isomer specific 2-hydroxyacid dehydrogenase NAD-binding [Xanthobacteraceae bacterium]
MPRFRVLATTPLHPDAEALLRSRCDYVVAPDTRPETLKREVAEADALIVRIKLPDDIFEGATRLRACIRHGVGLDFVPVEAATRAGIVVGNLVSANTQAVIEHVVGCVIVLARDLHELAIDFARNGWSARNRHLGMELAGKTLGIIGCGRIGRGVGEALHGAFGMRVIGYNRTPLEAGGIIEQATIDEVFARADVISLNIASTPETRGLVDARRLGLMKPEAFLINTGRGDLIDDHALVAALHAGRIGGAALDVFEPEPLPDSHPLHTAPRLFLTPHTGGGTAESSRRMSMEAVEDALRVLRGERPSNLVNPEIWDDYLSRGELLK